MTDEQGEIWGAKGANHCGVQSVSCSAWNDSMRTDLGKDLPFGDDVDFRMSA